MAKKISVKPVKFGKAAGDKKMLGSAKSTHNVGATPKKVKKIKESAGVTFIEKRRELLAAMLESIIDGDDVGATRALREYFPLKTHQIIMEKDDDDEIEERPEDEDMDHEDAEADKEGDHEEPDGDEDEDGEEPEDDDKDDDDEEDDDKDDDDKDDDDKKLFKK
jgi:hypothetical protein